MFVRYLKAGIESYGELKNEKITRISGDIFDKYEVTDETLLTNEVKLLSPVHPSKVVCVGLNYIDHAQEMNLEIPDSPLLFLKPSTTVVGHGDDVVHPEQTSRLDYEAEFAIVIGKKAIKVEEENAFEYVLGYTCANDITARDIQFSDGQWTRGKSFDTFCPLGPGIVKDIDPHEQSIVLKVNGEVKQKSNTNNLIFSVPFLVSYISKVMTLMPGDVIITGTPAGVGRMEIGDEVVVEIEGIGELRNKIV